MKIIGLTGRSGCGKSTVAEYYRSLNIPVADADLAARKALMPGSACIPLLQKEFGEDIVDETGAVRRRILADRAFARANGSQALIEITHAEIVRLLLCEANEAQEKGEPLFIVDGAVIVNAPFEKHCDGIIVVTAPLEASVHRICERDHITAESARTRLDAQLSEDALRKAALYEIRNDGSLEQLLARAYQVLEQLKGGM